MWSGLAVLGEEGVGLGLTWLVQSSVLLALGLAAWPFLERWARRCSRACTGRPRGGPGLPVRLGGARSLPVSMSSRRRLLASRDRSEPGAASPLRPLCGRLLRGWLRAELGAVRTREQARSVVAPADHSSLT